MAATASGWNWAYAHANDNAVGLVSLWVAECYALGHRLMVPHRKWAYTQEIGTHWYQSKPEDFSYLYQFIRENADLLDGYEPYSKIAVVYPNKSIRRDGLGSFQEICKRLADSNYQFSVVVAGDDWLEDRLNMGKLEKFNTVIVPEPSDLSESQKEVLQAWETSKSRKVNHVSSLDDISEVHFDPPSVRVTGASNIWALPRLRPDSRLVCHILNRNYDADRDVVVPVRDVKIVIRAPLVRDIHAGSCKLIVPGGEPVELDTELKNDELHISLPELGMWSLLVI